MNPFLSHYRYYIVMYYTINILSLSTGLIGKGEPFICCCKQYDCRHKHDEHIDGEYCIEIGWKHFLVCYRLVAYNLCVFFSTE